jgi:hypothetical protein
MGSFRIVLTLAIVFVLFSLPLQTGNVRAQGLVYQEDFEDGQAQGWTLEPGWQVIQVEGNYVLAGDGGASARQEQYFEGDQHLSFRINLLGGGIRLVFCLSEASRYFIDFDVNGTSLGKQFFPDPFQNNLAGVEAAHSLNRWYQVKIVREGNRIDFLLDSPHPFLAFPKLRRAWVSSQQLISPPGQPKMHIPPPIQLNESEDIPGPSC